jgi:hypothetical protein
VRLSWDGQRMEDTYRLSYSLYMVLKSASYIRTILKTINKNICFQGGFTVTNRCRGPN